MLSFTPAITKSLTFFEVYCRKNMYYLGLLHVIDLILESIMIFNPQWLYD